jgi:ribosomal protein S27E
MIPEPSDINEWPPHLVEWVVPTQIDQEGRFLDAAVRCPCGNREVAFHFRGGTIPNPCTIEFTGPDGDVWRDFVIEAVCTACGSRRVLFDRYVHRWEGAIQGGAVPDESLRPASRTWNCPACGGEPHQGTVRLVRDHILDFLERVPESVEEDYRNGFTWFAMDIRCQACGKETTSWVDYECR